jgi:hypothetical protein
MRLDADKRAYFEKNVFSPELWPSGAWNQWGINHGGSETWSQAELGTKMGTSECAAFRRLLPPFAAFR